MSARKEETEDRVIRTDYSEIMQKNYTKQRKKQEQIFLFVDLTEWMLIQDMYIQQK